MSVRSIFTRPAIGRVAALAGAIGLGIIGTVPAFAHVTVAPSTTAAGGYTIATFSVPHGCDGSATTKVAISIPDGINSVTPTRNSYYSVKKVTEQLNPPVTDAHGNQVTERVAQVVYTAKTPLPDGQRDAFELSFQVPDVEGETLLFPTVQTCEQGEAAWVEEGPEGGQEPEHPTPAFAVTATAEEGHGVTAFDEQGEATEDVAVVDEVAGVDESSGGGPDTVSWIALIVAALALVAGGGAFLRGRKS